MSEVTGRALDWDMTSAQASPGAQMKLAPGTYPFVVTGFEPMRYNGGAKIGPCPMARITVQITGAALDGGHTVTVTKKEDLKLWDSEFCMGLIGAFFKSIGSPDGPDGKTVVDWNAPLVGRGGWCEVDLHEFTRDGQTNTANGIKRWVPPEQAPYQQPAAYQAPAYDQQQYSYQPQAYQPPQPDPGLQAYVDQQFAGYAQHQQMPVGYQQGGGF